MDWLTHLAGFAGGVFLTNGVPHFVAGISGRKFHSPFASPPVRGLSSAVINVIWGIVNFSVAYILLKSAGFIIFEFDLKLFIAVLGMGITSLALAITFSRIDM